jgi:pyruvate/2-oxoglutarate dehydrogenase complex dihydrolipoamide dehydrogenase (E3) component
VLLDSSRRLDADYVVVASGAKYRYPAKADTDGDEDTMVRYRETHAALQRARSVLLLGAGAVGVELAGEITSTWPDTRVTIVDPLLELLGGRYDAALCAELRRQLEARGVRLLLGRTVSLPSTPPGELLPFAALTDDGEEVRADMWFPCFGISPDADYLGANGWLDVTPELRLRGSANVFAIGDVTGAAEWKNASTAQLQAEVAAHNILAHARGGDTRVYEPVRPNITIPLGSTGGAALRAGGVILGAEETVEAKSRVMHVPHYTEVLGAQPSSPRSAAS